MLLLSGFTVKKLPRHIIAAAMGVILLALSLSPLALMAVHSPMAAHAIMGTCTGECATCGCSKERSAARTCCCWQKQQGSERHEGHDRDETTTKETAVRSACPCGDNEHITFWGAGKEELLPARPLDCCMTSVTGTLQAAASRHITSRHPEPPDPPPKVSHC